MTVGNVEVVAVTEDGLWATLKDEDGNEHRAFVFPDLPDGSLVIPTSAAVVGVVIPEGRPDEDGELSKEKCGCEACQCRTSDANSS